MQPVVWVVRFKDGQTVFEFDDSGNESSFNALMPRKVDFEAIFFLDKLNSRKYLINLLTGEFFINGLPIGLSKNLDGRQHYFCNLPGVNYAEGVIQYKCSNPVSPGDRNISAATYNIGYKIPWNLEFWHDDAEGRTVKNYITHVQAMITIDAKTLKPGLSTLFTCQSVDRHGTIRSFKL